MTELSPPELPKEITYTACYCEENVYLLAQAFNRLQIRAQAQAQPRPWDIFALFISNADKTVALWNQKAAKEEGGVVVWDYHVVLVLRPANDRDSNIQNVGTWVYDFDTRLPVPCLWSDYVSQTLPFNSIIPSQYHSAFRMVPAQTFLDEFASDRSHMLRPTPLELVHHESLPSPPPQPSYLSPPPLHPPLRGPHAEVQGVHTNLMDRFVDMNPSNPVGFGYVLTDLDAFVLWCQCRASSTAGE